MSATHTTFLERYRGYFRNILKWEDLDSLWARLRSRADKGWYIYAVGEEPPRECVSGEQLEQFIEQLDSLLRREHDEDYCGIVYADDTESPSLVKIYDPNNLGSVCGSGTAPPPHPGWVLSLLPPEDLNVAFPPPANRRRWWQRVFG